MHIQLHRVGSRLWIKASSLWANLAVVATRTLGAMTWLITAIPVGSWGGLIAKDMWQHLHISIHMYACV